MKSRIYTSAARVKCMTSGSSWVEVCNLRVLQSDSRFVSPVPLRQVSQRDVRNKMAHFFFFFFITLGLEMSDTKVYEI